MPVAGELSAKIFKTRAKAVRKDATGVAFALVDAPADLSAAIRGYAACSHERAVAWIAALGR